MLLLLSVAIAGTAHAASPGKSRPQPGATMPLAPAHAGMVISLDPETGRLGMPSADQLVRLLGPSAFDLNHSDVGLVEERFPDGSAMLDLRGRFQEYSVARIGPDGRLVFDCLGDPAAVRQVLHAPPPPPAKEVE